MCCVEELECVTSGLAVDAWAKAMGVRLVADRSAAENHRNLHGAVEFYNLAKRQGVKPILGIEAYVAPDIGGKKSDRTNREFTGVSDGGFHLVLLAENNAGWQNLLKLSSDAFVNGFYFLSCIGFLTVEGSAAIGADVRLPDDIRRLADVLSLILLGVVFFRLTALFLDSGEHRQRRLFESLKWHTGRQNEQSEL